MLNINEFSLDNDLVAKISTHCFSQIKIIAPDYLSDKLKGRPRFKIDRRTKQIKLAGRGWQNNENQNYYIKTPPVKNGKPATTKFLRFAKQNNYAIFVKSKSGMLYRLLDIFNQQFGQYFSPLAFKEIEVESRQLEKENTAKKLQEKIRNFSKKHPITVIDIDGDNNNTVDYLVQKLQKLNIKTVDLVNTSLKLAVDHNAEYYSEKKLGDPYQPAYNTQHITVENIENLPDDSLNATLYSLIKELMIKNDLKMHRVSLVDKHQLPTQYSFFQKFKRDENETVLQFKFLLDNKFEIKEVGGSDNPFNDLLDEEGKAIELIIKNEITHTYFKIEKTNRSTLPNTALYDDMTEFTNHEKTPTLNKKDLIEATKELNDKKYDRFIELIESNKQEQYSASDVIGKLNEAQISKITQSKLAVILIEKYYFVISVNSRNAWARDRYFNGLTDINYCQNKDSIYYNVGIIGSGMKRTITRGSIVRKISPINLLNDEDDLSSKDIFELINTMLVTFVKYNNLTVLPFPEKYLNEYCRLNSKKDE